MMVKMRKMYVNEETAKRERWEGTGSGITQLADTTVCLVGAVIGSLVTYYLNK